MRGINPEARPPIDILYRRAFTGEWVRFENVNAFKAHRNDQQNTEIMFAADRSTEILDRWNASFLAEVIIVRNYANASDLAYYPRAQVTCDIQVGIKITLTAFPTLLPNVPRELVGSSSPQPTHLNCTANRAQTPRALEALCALPSPFTNTPSQKAPIMQNPLGQPITLGRTGNAPVQSAPTAVSDDKRLLN